MNLFVADPHWGWWIVLYFFLGGIAAGAYFTATFIDLLGREQDRELSRLGYWIAFPLVSLCGVLLIVDLDQPGRFWHMLFRSEVVSEAIAEGWPWSGGSWRRMAEAPHLKYWSPMSIGSWALLLFGLCSSLSFLGSLWPGGRLSRLLRQSIPGRCLQVVGCGVGFFVAAYTGALLTATNQPLWSDSTWIAPLFLTSAASTGIAALVLLASWRGAVAVDSYLRLERAAKCVLILEAVVFVGFLVSLGNWFGLITQTYHGMLLVVGTPVLAILLPLWLHVRRGRRWAKATLRAAWFALLGGLVLRYAILNTPPELLTRAAQDRRAAASLQDTQP